MFSNTVQNARRHRLNIKLSLMSGILLVPSEILSRERLFAEYKFRQQRYSCEPRSVLNERHLVSDICFFSFFFALFLFISMR